jgi:hypothetical protein
MIQRLSSRADECSSDDLSTDISAKADIDVEDRSVVLEACGQPEIKRRE